MTYKMEELIPVVAELAEKYTSKESSSIPYSKARQLMGAVIFCINEYEVSLKQGFAMTAADARLDAKQAYQAGYQCVLDKVKEAQNRWSSILIDFKSYGNRAYAETFADGMPAFFQYYDAKFQPQDHLLTLDYPLLYTDEKLCGIDRIDQYIRCVELEQVFLRQIPEEYIMHVLSSYDQGYEELFINLAGIVSRNILGCMIAGRKIDLQGYSEQEVECLVSFVEQRSEPELEQQLSQMIECFVIQKIGGSTDLAEYLKMDMRNFGYELKNAVKNRCVGAVLSI